MSNKEYEPLPASEPTTLDDEEQNLLPGGSSSRNNRPSPKQWWKQRTFFNFNPITTLVIGYVLGAISVLLFRLCLSSSCGLAASNSSSPVHVFGTRPAAAIASFPDDIGSTQTHAWPPPSPTNAVPSLFPTKVGFPGPTKTGAEPGLVLTAGTYPAWRGTEGLVKPVLWEDNAEDAPVWIEESPVGEAKQEKFSVFKQWGNLTPFHSVPSDSFGIKSDTGPEVPSGCTLKGVHILHRHGARYPTGWRT